MAWENVIMMHFLNIWMKRLSCLECSKIIGFPHFYSNLKWRLIQCPTWEVLLTSRVQSLNCRCVECQRVWGVECRRIGGVEWRRGKVWSADLRDVWSAAVWDLWIADVEDVWSADVLEVWSADLWEVWSADVCVLLDFNLLLIDF